MSETSNKIDIDQIRIKPALFCYALAGLFALWLSYKGQTDKTDKLIASVDKLTKLVEGNDQSIKDTDSKLIVLNGRCDGFTAKFEVLEAILPKQPTITRRTK